MAQKVLIGGGTGFIGQRLGELLRSMRKYEVINVSRKPGPQNMAWTSLENYGLPDYTHGVVNLAGQQTMDFTKQWTPGFKQNVYSSRVFTTRSLAQTINDASYKPNVFVVVTGVGAYAPSETHEYDEDSPISSEDFFSNLCVDWENAAKEVDTSQVRLVIIRSGVVLARWGGMIKNLFYPFFFGLGGPIGSGKQYLPWIHIDDLARLITFAIENEKVTGVLNGVAPQIITNEQFTKSFAGSMHRPGFFSIREGFLNFLLHPERANMLLKGQIVRPKRVQQYKFTYLYDDINKACSEFAQNIVPDLPKIQAYPEKKPDLLTQT